VLFFISRLSHSPKIISMLLASSLPDHRSAPDARG
jgi:hypothetical protein